MVFLAVVVVVVAVILLLEFVPGRTGTAAAPCPAGTGTVRVGESFRATHLVTHLALVSGSETEPRSRPPVYGLPDNSQNGPLIELQVLAGSGPDYFVAAGLVTTAMSIQGHPALMAVPPGVVPASLLAEADRVHYYWSPAPGTVISVTTSLLGRDLASWVAQGVSYSPGRVVPAVGGPGVCARPDPN